MATLDDLYGNKKSSLRYMKFDSEGEAFLLVQTGEPRLVPQKDQNGKVTWLVKFAGAEKYQPKPEGSFDPDGEDVENAFMPDKEIVIPAKVVGKKLRNGEKDSSFEPFDTEWELTKDQKSKHKEAMLDSGVPASEGTKYVVKLLSRAQKPYSYSIKMMPAE